MKLYFCLSVIILVAFSCQDENKNSDLNKKTSNQEKLVMYEPSELATLMLEMYDANQDWKAEILKGNVPQSFPDKYKEMHTAQSVNESAGGDFYNSMTDAYLNSIEDLTNATPVNAQEKYNAMVNVCIQCHQQICPGPIMKINKLIIN